MQSMPSLALALDLAPALAVAQFIPELPRVPDDMLQHTDRSLSRNAPQGN